MALGMSSREDIITLYEVLFREDHKIREFRSDRGTNQVESRGDLAPPDVGVELAQLSEHQIKRFDRVLARARAHPVYKWSMNDSARTGVGPCQIILRAAAHL